MRSCLSDFDMHMPKSLDDALTLIGDAPGQWRPFAGGTDLMVLMDAGKLSAGKYLAIWGLDELRGIDVSDREIRMGALTTFSDIRRSEELRLEFPVLVQAAVSVGAIQIQNAATIGGNIMNASPAADSVPALMVHDAEVELMSHKGTRRVPLASFFKGYKVLEAHPDELLTAVCIPRNSGHSETLFRKVGSRRAQTISKVVLAGRVMRHGLTVTDCRFAIGSVAATPIRLHGVESFLTGKVLSPSVILASRQVLDGAIRPIDDIRSTAEYRSEIAGNILQAFLEDLVR